MATSAEYTPLNHGGTPQSRLSPRTKRIGLRVVGVAVVSTVLAVCVFAFKSARRIDAAAALRTPIVSQVSPEHAGPTEDAIADLPGTPKAYTSRLFSGSLPVRSGGNGFYFFAESQSSTPLNDPMLLWLNGGPGASSLSGCFSENGPLLVNDGGQSLRVNEYAWNRNANMLCIESPIGVGFTYNASGVYKSDDVAQADDLYWMLQSFFTKFPWLRENDFIISGESYGGVYVPMTAKRIVEGNLGGEEPKINLKRFAVGNGITEYHGLSVVKFAYYHGLVGTDAYTSVVSKCPQLSSPAAPLNASLDEACTAELGTFQETIADIGINNYDIYAKCTGGSLSGMNALIERLKGPNQAEPRPIAMNVGLCLDWSDLATYFNLPSVRKAMHTNPKIEEWSMVSLTSANFDLGQVLNVSGTELRDIIKNKVLDYTPSIGMTVTPVWRYLLDHNISGVIYHGDTDMACDFMGGLWAVESLQLPRERARDVWNVRGSNQTAGFVEHFGTLKYVTVKGAGHMVPTDKPAEAKAMLDQFILSE